MKTPTLVLLMSVATATLIHAAAVMELHIGVSPFLPPEERQALARQLPALVLQPDRLAGGARVVVWDAWQLVTVAEFAIPNLKFDSPQARAPLFVKPLGSLGQWLRATPLADPAVPSDLPVLKAPELLELISRQPASAHRSILLLGSPLYLNLTEPSFSMTQSRYPTDAHLRASVSDSVFGLADKSNRLAHTTLHWCYFHETTWQTELHRTAITRWWGAVRPTPERAPGQLRRRLPHHPRQLAQKWVASLRHFCLRSHQRQTRNAHSRTPLGSARA